MLSRFFFFFVQPKVIATIIVTPTRSHLNARARRTNKRQLIKTRIIYSFRSLYHWSSPLTAVVDWPTDRRTDFAYNSCSPCRCAKSCNNTISVWHRDVHYTPAAVAHNDGHDITCLCVPRIRIYIDAAAVHCSCRIISPAHCSVTATLVQSN